MVCPTGTPELSEEQRRELEKQLKAREDLLLPMYYQVAVRFADLHDTPGRMQEKGVITVSRGSGGGCSAQGFCSGGTKVSDKGPSRGDSLCPGVPALGVALCSSPAELPSNLPARAASEQSLHSSSSSSCRDDPGLCLHFCRTSSSGRTPAPSSTGGCDGCCWRRR